jgi:type IV secretory pathway TraG/TraD family ATPase VirD4
MIHICFPGNQTITRQQKSTSFGANEFRDGVSYSEQQQRKELVEYADIANLATGECFILLPEPQVRLTRLQTPEVKLEDKNDGFVQGEERKVEKVVRMDTKAIKQTRETESIQADTRQPVNTAKLTTTKQIVPEEEKALTIVEVEMP